jgi:hypothetical protein
MVLVIFFLVYLTLACKELEETKILFIELGEKLVNIDSQKKVEISANELIQVDDYTLENNNIFLHIALENILVQHTTSLEI